MVLSAGETGRGAAIDAVAFADASLALPVGCDGVLLEQAPAAANTADASSR